MKFTHETKSVHRVHVEFSGGQVREMLLDRVSEKLHLDRDEAREHLRVDVAGEASGTTYVRGEVPMTRDEQLTALGLTPTEPVETDGAAVAEALGDHVTGVPDVVETPETAAAFEAVAGDHDQVSKLVVGCVDQATAVLFEGVRSLETVLQKMEAVGERDTRNYQRIKSVVDLLKPTCGAEPARGPNHGVQLGAGEYASESEELPEVQVDDPVSGLDLVSKFDDLFRDVGQVPERRAKVSEFRKLLLEYASRGPQRLVPRPVSDDNLRQARLKLAELAEGPMIATGRATAADLHYVLSLLGGEL